MKDFMDVGSGWLHGTLYEEERNTPDVCPGDIVKDKGERCKGKTRHNAKVKLSARTISFIPAQVTIPKIDEN